MRLNVWRKVELLGYPKHQIYQHHEMFSFTLDSLLLADYIRIRKDVKNILDLGTGNGVIPIYLTLKTEAKITGIEVQEDVYKMALANVLENKLKAQITLVLGDLHQLNCYPLKSYDLISANPPYFKVTKKSNLNLSPYKQIAKHELMVTLESLLKTVSKLLKNGGYFYLIYFPERLKECFNLLEKYQLEPKRMRLVYPNQAKKANHVLLEIKKSPAKGGLIIEAPLYIYQGDKWSDEVLKIYNCGSDNNAIE